MENRVEIIQNLATKKNKNKNKSFIHARPQEYKSCNIEITAHAEENKRL